MPLKQVALFGTALLFATSLAQANPDDEPSQRSATGSMESRETTGPGTSRPDMSQPGTAQPGAAQPRASQPGTSQPRTSQPGTSQRDGAAGSAGGTMQGGSAGQSQPGTATGETGYEEERSLEEDDQEDW